jgi:hypothetical protein
MNDVLERPTARLTLRKIGNSQGVTFPKSMLDGLDFSHGIEVERVAGELRLRPASDHDDPFGFGAAVRHRIETNTLDPLQIPDVLPEDGDF